MTFLCLSGIISVLVLNFSSGANEGLTSPPLPSPQGLCWSPDPHCEPGDTSWPSALYTFCFLSPVLCVNRLSRSSHLRPAPPLIPVYLERSQGAGLTVSTCLSGQPVHSSSSTLNIHALRRTNDTRLQVRLISWHTAEGDWKWNR